MSMKMDVHSNDPEGLTTGYQIRANASFLADREPKICKFIV